MKTFFEVQLQQRRRTAVLIGVEVVLLAAIAYLLTVPWQFWQSCSSEYSECQPMGFSWGLAGGSLVVVLGYLALAVAMAPRWALRIGARPPSDHPHERRLQSLLEQMAIAAGMPAPQLQVIDDPALNAFAAWDKGVPVVLVTSGLASRLDDRQMTGVLAHELAHLRNRDDRVVWIATFGVGLIVVLAVFATVFGISAAQQGSAARSSDDRKSNSSGAAIVALIFAALMWLVALPSALVVRATISRRREQLADASAVQFTRDPGGLRQALEILAASPSTVAALRTSNAALWINDPGRRSMPRWIAGLLDTHPPIEQRIAWLRRLEGANTDWLAFEA
jgi:heat shock protein HtpX